MYFFFFLFSFSLFPSLTSSFCQRFLIWGLLKLHTNVSVLMHFSREFLAFIRFSKVLWLPPAQPHSKSLRITNSRELWPSSSFLTTQHKCVLQPKSPLNFVGSRWLVNHDYLLCSFCRLNHVCAFLITRPPFQWRGQRQAMGRLPLFKMIGKWHSF